jgi:rRNA maturation RNase YbeY
MIIQFASRQAKVPVRPWHGLLRDKLPQALAMLPFSRFLERRHLEASLSILFAGEREMRAINLETRGVDSVTDVLSYPLLDMTHGRMVQALTDADCDLTRAGHEAVPLGEIVICLGRAFEQASEFGHSREREVVFLTVHGLLHLIGFDHLEPKQEKIMLRWQNKIMRELGLGRGPGRTGSARPLAGSLPQTVSKPG